MQTLFEHTLSVAQSLSPEHVALGVNGRVVALEMSSDESGALGVGIMESNLIELDCRCNDVVSGASSSDMMGVADSRLSIVCVLLSVR